MNAVKLDRVFAKPFIDALDGHSDAVYSLAKHPRSLTTLLSGSCDGGTVGFLLHSRARSLLASSMAHDCHHHRPVEIRVWNLSSRKATLELPGAHTGFVRGLCVVHTPFEYVRLLVHVAAAARPRVLTPSNSEDIESFLSCGDDKLVKLWSLPKDEEEPRHEVRIRCVSMHMPDDRGAISMLTLLLLHLHLCSTPIAEANLRRRERVHWRRPPTTIDTVCYRRNRGRYLGPRAVLSRAVYWPQHHSCKRH